MPYLPGTSQENLCRWLDEGLNAFGSTCSVGHQIHAEYAHELARSFDDLLRYDPSWTPPEREEIACCVKMRLDVIDCSNVTPIMH